MFILRMLLIITCCILAAYGYWGAFTESGNRVYEEMDAFKPFFFMVGSLSILLILGLYYLVIYIIRKSRA